MLGVSPSPQLSIPAPMFEYDRPQNIWRSHVSCFGICHLSVSGLATEQVHGELCGVRLTFSVLGTREMCGQDWPKGLGLAMDE